MLLWYDTVMKLLTNIFYSTLLVFLSFPSVTFAACGSSGGFSNPLQNICSIADFTKAVLEALVFILFPLAVVFVVYSGFLFIAAQGNSEKLARAKTNFIWTLIGVALLLGAWALSVLIQGTIDPILGK